jgi:hypothetical protein
LLTSLSSNQWEDEFANKLKQFWNYLIAAVDLGIGLLQQGHPELIGIQAVSVAIHTLPHWQPAIHSLIINSGLCGNTNLKKKHKVKI